MELATALARLSQANPREVIVFTGAGFVADLGFPLWPTFLSKAVDFLQDLSPEAAALMRKRIAQHQLLAAADCLYGVEVPTHERVRYLNKVFDVEPPLTRRHKLLGALPIAAFATTNFDHTIERALTANDRLPLTFRGSQRFQLFNSELPKHRDRFENEDVGALSRGLVLKVHNDIMDPEALVLNTRSYETLTEIEGFETFYQNALRQATILFLGYSGSDSDFLLQIANRLSDYAGHVWAASYFFAPGDTKMPTLRGNIVPVPFDAGPNFGVIDDILKPLNDAWRSTLTATSARHKTAKVPEQERALSDVAQKASANAVTIFHLMVPALQAGTTFRVMDQVAVAMVRSAIGSAGKGAARSSVVNQLAQQFKLSYPKAEELVATHLQDATEQGALPPEPSTDLDTLAAGIRHRCLSFDTHFRLSIEKLRPIVRSTIEFSLQWYGCSLGVALLKQDRPASSDLSSILRAILAEHQWHGVGEVEKQAFSLAFPDLFLSPTPEEARVLGRLAVVSSAFGLIQAIPTLSLAQSLLPTTLYLDTTLVLPLVARTDPRAAAYATLLRLAKTLHIKLVYLRPFVNEVLSHYKGALRQLEQRSLKTVGELVQFMSGAVEDFVNVFLLFVVQRKFDPSANARRVLDDTFGGGSDLNLTERIRQLGITIVEPDTSINFSRADVLQQSIFIEKSDWYDRSPAARNILARNEAVQMLELEAVGQKGVRAWFATGDSQLRRLARLRDLPACDRVLPVGGVISVLNSFVGAGDIAPSFARLLWKPSTNDDLDQVLSRAMRDLVSQIPDNAVVPIEEARELARAEYRRQVSLLKEDTDFEVDTHSEETRKIMRESVYRILGELLKKK